MNSESLADIGIDSIFHPSDFTEASEVAFAHALKIALAAGAELALFHAVEGAGDVDWHEFPGVRRMLERWKVLPHGRPRNAVTEFGISVEKIAGRGRGPVDTVLHYLESHPTNLIVLATHATGGRMQWLRSPVAEPIARDARQMTLFVPHGVEGFVSREDGSVRLRNVLIPAALTPWPQPAVTAATRLAAFMAVPTVEFHLMHMGGGGRFARAGMPAASRMGLEQVLSARAGNRHHRSRGGGVSCGPDCDDHRRARRIPRRAARQHHRAGSPSSAMSAARNSRGAGFVRPDVPGKIAWQK